MPELELRPQSFAGAAHSQRLLRHKRSSGEPEMAVPRLHKAIHNGTEQPRPLSLPGLLPGLTVRGRERVYSSSPSCSAATGVSVPKRPSVSLLGPAVKNRVLEEPAPPLLPNVRDHRPSMKTGEPSLSLRMKPMNFLVKPLKAAIQPLRKLPTRMVLLNSPKSRGVQTTPQGALNQSPCSRRPWNLPVVLKISTKPRPSPPTGS